MTYQMTATYESSIIKSVAVKFLIWDLSVPTDFGFWAFFHETYETGLKWKS